MGNSFISRENKEVERAALSGPLRASLRQSRISRLLRSNTHQVFPDVLADLLFVTF